MQSTGLRYVLGVTEVQSDGEGEGEASVCDEDQENQGEVEH